VNLIHHSNPPTDHQCINLRVFYSQNRYPLLRMRVSMSESNRGG
jgi:hypothetical protein